MGTKGVLTVKDVVWRKKRGSIKKGIKKPDVFILLFIYTSVYVAILLRVILLNAIFAELISYS